MGFGAGQGEPGNENVVYLKVFRELSKHPLYKGSFTRARGLMTSRATRAEGALLTGEATLW